MLRSGRLAVILWYIALSVDSHFPSFKRDEIQSPLVVVVGLPKSGTTSIDQAFNAIGLRSAHYVMSKFTNKFCGDSLPIKPVTVHRGNVSTYWGMINKTNGCYVGLIMQRAMSAGRPSLDDLISLGYRVFAQMDCCWPRFGFCLLPQVDALDELTIQYPGAYFIQTRRQNSTSHFASLLAWGNMAWRFSEAGLFRRFLGRDFQLSNRMDDGIELIDVMNEEVSRYFQQRPHLHFLSLDIESKTKTKLIRDFLGLKSDHFSVGHFNARNKTLLRMEKVSRC